MLIASIAPDFSRGTPHFKSTSPSTSTITDNPLAGKDLWLQWFSGEDEGQD